MVLSYLRWEYDPSSLGGCFGVVASPSCLSSLFLKARGWAVSGANEAINVWAIKGGQVVARFVPRGEEFKGVGARARPLVTFLAAHPREENQFVAGYSDGSLRLWNLDDAA